MTYPEGRKPMSWDDVMGVKHVSHPSTWEAEAKALRARVQELKAVLQLDPWKVGFAHWKALRARALGDDQ